MIGAIGLERTFEGDWVPAVVILVVFVFCYGIVFLVIWLVNRIVEDG